MKKKKIKPKDITPVYITIAKCASRLSQSLNTNISKEDLKEYLLQAKMIDINGFVHETYADKGFFLRKAVYKKNDESIQNKKQSWEILITPLGLSFLKQKLREILNRIEEK